MDDSVSACYLWSVQVILLAVETFRKMYCTDVMATIDENGTDMHDDQGDESNFEQLMVSMLDERDKLMESLRETQETVALTKAKLSEANSEKDGLMRRLEIILAEVSFIDSFLVVLFTTECIPFQTIE